MIRVTVWNEGRHEKQDEQVRRIYPNGIHGAIAGFLGAAGDMTARTATLDESEHGLTEEVLQQTDVLIWWGHRAHQEVQDEIVRRVHRHVLEGMGLIVLHSGHLSKVFTALMGTSCCLKWRAVAEKDRLWNIKPTHPITAGVGDYIELTNEEMYGEPFDIPEPDELIFISWFQGGEVFRSGCTFNRGHGRVFYFSPGHETYPTFYHPDVQKVLINACRWAAARVRRPQACAKVQPLEEIPPRQIDMTNVK